MTNQNGERGTCSPHLIALGALVLAAIAGACGSKDPGISPGEDAAKPAPAVGSGGSTPQVDSAPGSTGGSGGSAPAPVDTGVDRAADAPASDAGGTGGTGVPPVDGGAPEVKPQMPGTLAPGAACERPGMELGGCMAGYRCCKPCCDGRAATCQRPVENTAGIGVGECPLPDLALDLKVLATERGAGPATFQANMCAVREMCVEGAGRRNLVHFEVRTPNVGTADLVLGDPTRRPGFTYASCHDHYHFENYALYQILDVNGNEVLSGKKKAFCLMDSEPHEGYPLTRRTDIFYNCSRQGISKGWSDSYYNGLECQYVDVSMLAPGRYKLRVTVNPQRVLPELRYDNNMGEVDIDVPGPAADPTSPCQGNVPGANRECGWKMEPTKTCVAGRRVTVGCGSECGLGTRTGDPMLRICPGDQQPCADTGTNSNDDCVDRGPMSAEAGASVTFTCPPSGQYTIMTATTHSNKTSTCNYAIR